MKDWRETLFVWDGILGRYENDHNDNKNSGKDDITWKGTWIGYIMLLMLLKVSK